MLAGNLSYTALAQWAGRLTQAQLKRLRARYNPRTERFEPPSEPTLRRVLQRCDAPAVDALLSDWLLGVTDTHEPLAVDGKVVRGAVRADGTQVHLLSAFLQHPGVTVAQREIPSKTNEIPEFQPLLEPLDLSGRVVTADALHTQRETARFLVEDQQAHDFFTVKPNQPTLYADLSALTEAHFPPVRRNPGSGPRTRGAAALVGLDRPQ